MARTKFVLNERRLALLEARRNSAARIEAGETDVGASEGMQGSLYEELKDI